MTDAFSQVVGQSAAVSMLRNAVVNPAHAYLLNGPDGSGLRNLAVSFAAELLAHERENPEDQRRLALAEAHPDLLIVEREGLEYRAEEAESLRDAGYRSPFDGDRQIILIEDIHLANAVFVGMTLKVLEEPPPSTYFVLTANEITPALATIASRCTPVDLAAVDTEDLVEHLQMLGVDEDRSRAIANIADSSIDRAVLLASDSAALERWETWSQLRTDLDGTGAAVTLAVDRLLQLVDESAEPLRKRQEQELEALDELAERYGERGLGRSKLEIRHKRELRRLRTDELLMGMTAVGNAISEGITNGSIDASSGSRSLVSLNTAANDLRRNGNERLQLQNLFINLKV